MAKQEKAIVQTFTSYVEAFQTLNPQAPLPYCHVPCVFIAPQGVLIMAGIDEIEKFFTRVMEGLKARGYTHSELRTLEVKQMSGDVALVSVSRVRYKNSRPGTRAGRRNLYTSQHRPGLEDRGGNDSRS